MYASIVTLLLLHTWTNLAKAVSVPACQTTAPQLTTLTNVTTANTNATEPFGLTFGLSDDIAFVALNTTLGVLNTSTFPPVLVHKVPLPLQYLNDSIVEKESHVVSGATGIVLSSDGRHVLVTAFSTWLVVVDVARAIIGAADAVVGAVNGSLAAGNSAVEVAITKDDRYAFVSQEDPSPLSNSKNGTIEVFELYGMKRTVGVSGRSVGYLTLGVGPVGMVLSPDGRYLYATSEGPGKATTPQGTLSTFDVETLKHDPSKALLSTVIAGCGAVRVIISGDGAILWVTVRESNHVVAFDRAKLVSCPGEALLASVQVGTSPVGLVLVRNDTRILTADSNRFRSINETSGISVVDVQAALRGAKADLGQISSGIFPRELAVSPNGKTVLMGVFGSNKIQAIDVATLP
ncbi:hypothetical protein LTR56_013448 [Elasticomyces elasticus]|nr:hypothetical protein LTR56_013448 [Elasticomyces elasticus]KAK3652292.1 hypothetical protein LTR22_011794 [Elasticomyces elasticus]KAK4910134.1 hypothetical protein LTR49_021180 [Elasticomyces elasticus]KAK5753908.1 hypothetical protein LTS12_016000 [Elasticomyces elasticus]